MTAARYEFRTAQKPCAGCGKPLVLRNTRDLERRRFCSQRCKGDWQAENWKPKPYSRAQKCENCGIDFIAGNAVGRYCSKRCQGVVSHARDRVKHTDLRGHIKRLLVYQGRKQLSLDGMMAMYERQGGKCALTGLTMTWERNVGKVTSNVSIDRISSLGGYTEDNVQLVCSIANIMKHNLSVADFEDICRRVVETSLAKQI